MLVGCSGRAEVVLKECFEPKSLNCERADLSGANLEGANLKGANLKGAFFRGANLSGANLSGANLEDAWFTNANLEGAILTDAKMTGAQLAKTNLKGVNLVGANLTRADLFQANMQYANLLGANLQDAIVSLADFSFANLTNLDMSGLDLSGANLTGANLTGTNFYGATNLGEVKGYSDQITTTTATPTTAAKTVPEATTLGDPDFGMVCVPGSCSNNTPSRDGQYLDLIKTRLPPSYYKNLSNSQLFEMAYLWCGFLYNKEWTKIEKLFDGAYERGDRNSQQLYTYTLLGAVANYCIFDHNEEVGKYLDNLRKL